MLFPFLFSFNYFTEAKSQAIGILIFLASFLIGDFVSYKKTKILDHTLEVPINFSNNLFLFLTVVAITLPLFHYLIVGDVPIFHLLFGTSTPLESPSNRFEFNRASIPYGFALLSNYFLFLVTPTLLAFFLVKRYFVRFILISTWTLFYSISSGAKGYLLFILFSFLLITSKTLWKAHAKKINTLIAVSFLSVVLSGVALGSTALSRHNDCPLPQGAEFTPTNVFRSCETDISIHPIIDTLGYRVFLTPVEVSNNWYEFFSDPSQSRNNLADLLNREQELKPSNIVAQEYYFKFWPNRYATTTNANASIDAEAFSYGGVPLQILFAVLIIFFRNQISSTKSKINDGQIIETLGISYLTFLPISTSLPAILIPDGFWIILVIIFFRKFYANKKSNFDTL